MQIESVGSFLPDETLINALSDHQRGAISDARLTAVEDAAVADIVERQLALGLEYITSGEFRRKHWAQDFWFGLDGLSCEHVDTGHVYQTVETDADLLHVTGRIAYAEDHPFFTDFGFLHQAVAGRAKTRQSLPSPANLLLEIYALSAGKPENLYPQPDALVADIAEAYRLTIMHLYELGCRAVQYDDTALGLMCDDIYTKRLLQGGVDLLALHSKLISVINLSLTDLPADLETSIYISGGDTIVPEWEYIAYPDNVMPKALTELAVSKFFLPFELNNDYSLKVLTLIPEGKTVVMGLVDAHTPLLDNCDAVKLNLAKAQAQAPALNFALSPRTGFKLSSFSERALSYEDQWRKLASLQQI